MLKKCFTERCWYSNRNRNRNRKYVCFIAYQKTHEIIFSITSSKNLNFQTHLSLLTRN